VFKFSQLRRNYLCASGLYFVCTAIVPCVLYVCGLSLRSCFFQEPCCCSLLFDLVLVRANSSRISAVIVCLCFVFCLLCIFYGIIIPRLVNPECPRIISLLVSLKPCESGFSLCVRSLFAALAVAALMHTAIVVIHEATCSHNHRCAYARNQSNGCVL